MKYGTLSLMLLAGLLLGSQAQAQILDTIYGTVGVDTHATTTSISTDANVDVDTTMSASGTTSGLVDLTSDTDTALSFRFSKDSMDDGTDYATTEAHEVRSSAGLSAYAATTVRDDERVKAVALANGSLDFTYRLPARFLGFIPGSLNTTVSVDEQGDVSVDYPWYAFLMNKSESSSALESRISSEMRMDGMDGDMDVAATSTTHTGIQTGTQDVRYWAQVIERVHASLKANA